MGIIFKQKELSKVLDIAKSLADKRREVICETHGKVLVARRVAEVYFVIDGAKCRCGGELSIRDWAKHGDMRYETSCEKCLKCDPNGHPSLKKALEGAANTLFKGSRTLTSKKRLQLAPEAEALFDEAMALRQKIKEAKETKSNGTIGDKVGSAKNKTL